MGARDPFRTLELRSDATADDVRAARRRLAKRLHPDRGGDARHMQELNAAAAEALAMIDAGIVGIDGTGSNAADGSVSSSTSTGASASGATHRQPPTSSPRPSGEPERRRSRTSGQQRGPWRVIEDVPSFVIEALPDTAFSLLQATAPSVGTVLDADPPYVLDVRVSDPMRCWCRLELLPEGAATAVNLYIGDLADVTSGAGDGAPIRSPFPDIDEVRDTWIAALNTTEWPTLPF